MVQAARSGKQNILEGSMASGTSKETEIKLTNVARASLEELLADYRDFLRQKGFELWFEQPEHKYQKHLRELIRKPDFSHQTLQQGIENPDPSVSANVLAGLIVVTNFLLEKQLKQLEQHFIKEGGLRERMTRARLNERNKQS
ncbi:MAG: four helix bundle suffix domain-containing protein [Sumerlaeia bacterium]